MDYETFKQYAVEAQTAANENMVYMCGTDFAKDYLYQAWRTGGMSGGSCWGGTPQPFHVNVSEPDTTLHALINLLTNVAPTISFLQYERIKASVSVGSHTNQEYYGNEDYYSYVQLSIEKLYKMLNEMNALE